MRERFDSVVIGSGAGGAPIAYELARKGRSVLVLEKGPLLRTQDDQMSPGSLSDFKRDEMFNFGFERIVTTPGMTNTGASYYGSHVEPDLNDEPHIYTGLSGTGSRVTVEGYTAQCLGGGTQLYGAVSLRFTETDLQLQSFNQSRQSILKGNAGGNALQHVRDWPISYAELEPYYTKAERLIGINGTQAGQAKSFSASTYQQPLAPNPISDHARAGMQALGMPHYRTPLAVITEQHGPSGRAPGVPNVGYVNRYGDPMGLKSNTWVTLLRPTILAGHPLTLRPNCVVTHLTSQNRRVTGVHYRDPSGQEVVVEGEHVIVACSAIESIRLLMLSAEHDRTGFGAMTHYQESQSVLGRFFLTHTFGGAEVAMKNRRYDKTVSLDSDYATDFCASRDFLDAKGLWAGAAVYNNTSDQALPISLAATHGSADLDSLWTAFAGDSGKRGDELIKWMDADLGTRLSVSFMGNQVPREENRIELHGVTDKWNRKVAHIIKDFTETDEYLMDVMADQCKQILEAGVAASDLGSLEYGSVRGSGWRIANHILGGARFGVDPTESVLDRNCRLWDCDNLYVTDGAFMPTSGGANPTLTIQANAFRVADSL